jgi:hypothetical protein
MLDEQISNISAISSTQGSLLLQVQNDIKRLIKELLNENVNLSQVQTEEVIHQIEEHEEAEEKKY